MSRDDGHAEMPGSITVVRSNPSSDTAAAMRITEIANGLALTFFVMLIAPSRRLLHSLSRRLARPPPALCSSARSEFRMRPPFERPGFRYRRLERQHAGKSSSGGDHVL